MRVGTLSTELAAAAEAYVRDSIPFPEWSLGLVEISPRVVRSKLFTNKSTSAADGTEVDGNVLVGQLDPQGFALPKVAGLQVAPTLDIAPPVSEAQIGCVDVSCSVHIFCSGGEIVGWCWGMADRVGGNGFLGWSTGDATCTSGLASSLWMKQHRSP